MADFVISISLMSSIEGLTIKLPHTLYFQQLFLEPEWAERNIVLVKSK